MHTQFPPDFIWGLATSAYQIEGAWDEDGRVPSIWDVFSHKKGKVRREENGNKAAEHYHRWQGDFELLSQLKIPAYRFSIAWTRVMDTQNKPNQRGLDFYKQLIDNLLERGIKPYPTLYHYDLPQHLQEKDGWANRETAYRFSEYTEQIVRHLGDRVNVWTTLNEPWIAAMFGNLLGMHAPGLRNPARAVSALHHMLLAHGLAVAVIRQSAGSSCQVGITLNLSPIYPYSNGRLDIQAANWLDGLSNGTCLDPLLSGKYPDMVTQSLLWKGLSLFNHTAQGALIQPDDLKIISAPLDFVGINYYLRNVIRWAPVSGVWMVRPKDSEYTQMGAEIYPEGIYTLLKELHVRYPKTDWLILENGMPDDDRVDDKGEVDDLRRIKFLRDHLLQVKRAIQEDVPVRGYFAWSFLDNFEWAYGYAQRFGLVHVNFKTQERRIKKSGYWYSRVIQNNALID